MNTLKFTLSLKNQKGQVAIFVALIFQVIFVFFALLINVGLIVHHKINLQQSTDLAAYYGAMKQAESLNAIAHVNYQIKQAWKLLAWRYRIAGTFGFQNTSPGVNPLLPVTLKYVPLGISVINTEADLNSPSGKCASGMNTLNYPFFCVGHAGLAGWRGGQAENTCKINCGLIEGTVAITVPGVPRRPIAINTDNISGRVDTAMEAVNNRLRSLCETVGQVNIRVLANMILSYRRETMVRSQTLLMLAGNLSNDTQALLDLNGDLVEKGVAATLRNNLTEANRSSMSAANIKTYNSFSHGSCSMQKGPDAGRKRNGKQNEFLKRIEFELVQFFIHDCKMAGTTVAPEQKFQTGSIFKNDFTSLSDGSFVGTKETPKIDTHVSSDIAQEILSLVTQENEKFTVGYEKNPWCPGYFAVTATAEPKIPFLPLAKIKLTASSVAKPFGGSVGPWYGKTWNHGAPTSQEGITASDNGRQVDPTLPIANAVDPSTFPPEDTHRLLANFSRFVGDKEGLSNPVYVGEYHAALINRLPRSTGTNLSFTSRNGKLAESTPLGTFDVMPTHWPSLTSWDNTYDISDPVNYDPLTKGPVNNDSYFRDLEISAIAPNQFDLTYYSIDPDFYNNYYKRLSDQTIFNKLKSAAGMGPAQAQFVRPDFGNNKNIYSIEDFGIRNQVEIVKKVFGTGFATGLDNSAPRFINVFPYLVTKQQSLLTSWTFKNLTDFTSFPMGSSPAVDNQDNTMAFGHCLDKWQNNGDLFDSPVKIGLPPTSGNCVTGGRSGYSVKLVSPDVVRSAAPQPLGSNDGSVTGPILNPLPADFLQF